MISDEYLPILPSFSSDPRAFLNDIFRSLYNSTTILGVMINGTFGNLAAFDRLTVTSHLTKRSDLDLWFEDECHFQQHGSRCTMWVQREDV